MLRKLWYVSPSEEKDSSYTDRLEQVKPAALVKCPTVYYFLPYKADMKILPQLPVTRLN